MGAFGTPTPEGLKALEKAEKAIWKQDKFVTHLLTRMESEEEQFLPEAERFTMLLFDKDLQEFYEASITSNEDQ